MSVNDCKYIALMGAGYTGTLNDMTLAWLQDQTGVTSGQINDAWHEYMDFLGYKDLGHINDIWFAWLTGLGYSGTLNDMWYAFWCEMAAGVPLDYSVAWDEDFYDSITGLDARFVLDYPDTGEYAGFGAHFVVTEPGSPPQIIDEILDGSGELGISEPIGATAGGPVTVTVRISNPVSELTGPEKLDSTNFTVRTPVSHLEFSDYIDGTLLEDIAGWEKVDGPSTAVVQGGVLQHTIHNGEASYQYTGTPTIDVSDMAMAWVAAGGAIPIANAIIDDVDNLVGARITNGTLGIFRRIAGAWTLIGSQLSGQNNFLAYLTLFAGTDISVFQDGVLVMEPLATGYTPGVGAMPGLQCHGVIGPIASELFVWDMSEAGPPDYP